MERPIIKKPEDSITQLDLSVGAASMGEPAEYCPTNKDLIAVIQNWDGMVCVEFVTDAKELCLKVDKEDLVQEIERCWQLDGLCNLEISCCNYAKKILVFKHF